MALRADRVGVRPDQVDVHGRVTSQSFLNELIESLPEWTDMPVWVNGTEEILPSNGSVPVTSPILADIQYPDVRRNDQYFTYRESPTTVDGLAKLKRIKGNTLVFNQSTLLSFKGTSIKTTGKNLLENKGVASVNLSGVITTKNDDGSITVNGTANGNNVYSFNSTQANVFGLVLPSGNYKMVLVNGGANDGQVGIQRSGVNSYVYTNANGVANFTVQNGDLLRIAFYVTSGKTYNTTLKAMICSSDADNTFEPYTSHTTNLPTLTYFPTGMKSAGNVYDELLPTKAITRVGMVDLGTLDNWYYNTDALSFSTFLPDANRNNNNIICSKYPKTNLWQVDKTCRLLTNGNLVIFDSTYTDVTAFKTAMNGVYLYYELATPIELPTMSFE